VRGELGRGVFSTVLNCVDTVAASTAAAAQAAQAAAQAAGLAPPELPPGIIVSVAIKFIRNNDVMRKAAAKEIGVLKELSAGDRDSRRHCVRLLSSFEHRGHTAMVFECSAMNLRETLKKFGKGVGINIKSVRSYSRQLLIALRHIASLRVVHADIKPDNILVSEDFRTVQLCDFGSAFRETDPDNDPTPYLQSRFYRAPEVRASGDGQRLRQRLKHRLAMRLGRVLFWKAVRSAQSKRRKTHFTPLLSFAAPFLVFPEFCPLSLTRLPDHAGA